MWLVVIAVRGSRNDDVGRRYSNTCDSEAWTVSAVVMNIESILNVKRLSGSKVMKYQK